MKQAQAQENRTAQAREEQLLRFLCNMEERSRQEQAQAQENREKAHRRLKRENTGAKKTERLKLLSTQRRDREQEEARRESRRKQAREAGKISHTYGEEPTEAELKEARNRLFDLLPFEQAQALISLCDNTFDILFAFVNGEQILEYNNNKYSISPFEFGEEITGQEARLLLTAFTALSSLDSMLIRKVSNGVIQRYLIERHNTCQIARYNLKPNGEFAPLSLPHYGDIKEYVQNGVSVLLSYREEIYSKEIFDKVRNRLSALWYERRVKGSQFVHDIEQAKEAETADNIMRDYSEYHNDVNYRLFAIVREYVKNDTNICILFNSIKGREARLTQAEIAKRYGITKQAVGQRLKTAVGRLAKHREEIEGAVYPVRERSRQEAIPVKNPVRYSFIDKICEKNGYRSK